MDRTPLINMSLAPALAVTTRRTHDQDTKRQLQAIDKELTKEPLVELGPLNALHYTTLKTLSMVDIA